MQVFNIQEDITCPRVKSICFHRTRSVILLALHNGEIAAYDYSLSAYIHKFLDHEGPVRSIHFHPSNDIFVSGGDDQFVRIWDYTTKTHVKLKGHSDYIRCVKFHPFEPFILSTSDDRTVKIWNFQSKKKIKTLAGHTNYVMAAEFLNDQRVVSVSLDQTIRIWNIEDGTSEIIEAHDKGINALSVLFKMNDFVIFTGSDDKSIKMFNSDLISTDCFNYHNKSITGLLSFEKTIISCGEDGFLFINKNKQTKRIERDGRFWCLARNEQNMIAAGHDNSFIIFGLKNKLVYDQRFLIRDNKVLNHKNEKIIDLKKEVKNIVSNDELLIINYTYKFEVYKHKIKKFLWSETGNGFFFHEMIISENKGEYHSFTFTGKVKEERIFSISGHAIGSKEFIYVFCEKKLYQINKKYEKFSATLPFIIEKVVTDDNFVIVMGKNDFIVLDRDLRILRHIKEMVKIFSIKIHDGIIFYTTEKQIKYIFEKTDGIICTTNSMYLIDIFEKNGKDFCLLANDEQTVEREINTDEIKFKIAVLNDDKDVIESFIGNLPGMCLINFLNENGRGEIALPYIKNQKEKFELYISMNDFENAFNIAESKNEYEKIIEKALEKPEILKFNIDFVEKSLKKIENDFRLFLFYVAIKNEDKILNTTFKDLNAKMLQAFIKKDRKTVIQMLKSKENIITNTALIETEEQDDDFKRSENDEIYHDLDEQEINDQKSNDKIYDFEELQTKPEFIIENCNYDNFIVQACNLFELGKVREAKKIFLSILYTLNDSLSEEKRFLIGNYLAGIESEKKRKKEQDVKKILERVCFFYNLKLLPQHRNIQVENYVAVNYKNKNFDLAKSVAKNKEGDLYQQVMQSNKSGNIFSEPKGVFCCDIGAYKLDGYHCIFCGNYNEKEKCAICLIGKVVK